MKDKILFFKVSEGFKTQSTDLLGWNWRFFEVYFKNHRSLQNTSLKFLNHAKPSTTLKNLLKNRVLMFSVYGIQS